MININGHIVPKDKAHLSINNRGFTYGDAIFETIKVLHNRVLFLEDHYFRLMASMRILRMEIPMNFTLEFIESQMLELIEINKFGGSSLGVNLMVNRIEGGLYSPNSNNIEYTIMVEELEHGLYMFEKDDYKIDLFKDFYISPSLTSTLKTNNRIINIVGSIFSKENNFENCLILNTEKSIVQALNANIFLVKDNVVKTPPLQDGCIKGIMRKQIIELIKLMPDFILEETSITPFELQKADELFLTNVIMGIRPITHYRKKVFTHKLSEIVLDKLNLKISQSN